MRFRVWRVVAGVVALVGMALLSGCSEKGGLYRWDPVHPSNKTALPGLVSMSTDEVMCVGYDYPAEGARDLRMRCLQYSNGTWNVIPVPGHELESARLLSAAKSTDGTVWACGSAQGPDADLSTTVPLMYHYSGAAWSEVSLADAGDVSGSELTSIAAGPGGEIRAVGPAFNGHAIVLRYTNGAWSTMPLPVPIGGADLDWTLTTVACDPSGVWYAAGGSDIGGPPGGVLFRDSGSGWESVAGPGTSTISISSLAFDGSGDLWVAGNYPLADSTQGILYHHTASGYQQVPITLVRPGAYRIFAMAFGAEGRGWVAGGRAPDDPFFAGMVSGSSWTEVVEQDRPVPTPGSGVTVEEGGEIFALGLLPGDRGWASGQAEESELEGGVEFVARVFRLLPAEEESERGAPGRLTAPPLAARRFSNGTSGE